MAENFEDLMREVGGDFDNASADGFGEEVPEGEYICVVNKCDIGKSKSSGRWQVGWDLAIIWDPKGKYKNRHIFAYDGITKVNEAGKSEPNEGGMRALKNRFKNAGLGLVTKDSLPIAVTQVLGRCVHIKVQTKGDFTNVYFQGLVATNLTEFRPPASLQALQNQSKGQAANPAPKTATLPTTPTVAHVERPKLTFEE